ncbi:MAG: TlpA disulfide reductase family protein [Terracidiphilus sp.]
MPGLKSTVRLRLVSLASLCLVYAAANPAGVAAQSNSGGPSHPKAQKTFDEAAERARHGDKEGAADEFRKANKQDGGRCATCLNRAYKLALESGDLKTAQAAVADQMPLPTNDSDRAELHFRLALVLQRRGIKEKNDALFTESCHELKTALALDPQYSRLHYLMGISLAWLHQDDAARSEFNAFLSQDKDDPSLHERARRYAERIDLARSRMAPPFSAATIDGQRISLDSLAGKVVLIDFWATWCPPCVAALPHIRQIAHAFEGQPLVVISVSFDSDDAKWREFVVKNRMTWVQIRDGKFTGPLAQVFDIRAIPATLTIDADGVLEDQHEGDAAIDGTLKKLIAQAQELANRKSAEPAAVKPVGAGN